MTTQNKPKLLSSNLNNWVSLSLSEYTEPGIGDSSVLQKGLIMSVEGQSVCGEGMGFGVPAVEYSNEFLFSSTATVKDKNDEWVKTFFIDSSPKKTWRGKFRLDNQGYLALWRRLANVYRSDKRLRSLLTYMIKLQSLLGITLSYQNVEVIGSVDICYRFVENGVVITVDYSKLDESRIQRLLLFNEQSSCFSLYHDENETLSGEDIGVWEEIGSKKACLTYDEAKISFCVKKIPGTKLYRGRELLHPRLDWSGFCYSIPPNKNSFSYSISII